MPSQPPEGADDSSVDASATPSDAFQVLGNETRTTVLRTLAKEGPCTFSELAAGSDADTTAGFAYHLRQIDGEFVCQRDDDRYELTYAGREVEQAIRSGAYTDSVDRCGVDLDESCPFCDEASLVARVEDNVTRVECRACDTPLLGLSLPPSGYAVRDADDVPAAIDAYHRRRIAAFADGVCPDCGGTATAEVETAAEQCENGRPAAETEEDSHVPIQIAYDCDGCGSDLRCPATLTVLDHPAVVAFYHDHDEDLRDRPIWNVGPEWRERVLSREPWCVLASTCLDGDCLDLYVAGDGTVVDHQRRNLGGDGEESGVEGRTLSASASNASEDEAGPGEDRADDGATA